MVSRRLPRTGSAGAQLSWVNIPDCGSSFGATVVSFGCPAAAADEACEVLTDRSRRAGSRLTAAWEAVADRCVRGADASMTLQDGGGFFRVAPLTAAAVPRVVFTLRNPTDRLLARFRDSDGGGGGAAALQAFAADPRNRHCVTKTLSGKELGCASTADVDESDALRAADVVHQAAFVGLHEYWELSVQLFHCAWMPGVKVRPAELRVYDKPLEKRDRARVPRDDLDWTVYKAAAKRFFADVKTHAQCLADLVLEADDEDWGDDDGEKTKKAVEARSRAVTLTSFLALQAKPKKKAPATIRRPAAVLETCRVACSRRKKTGVVSAEEICKSTFCRDCLPKSACAAPAARKSNRAARRDAPPDAARPFAKPPL